MLRLARIQYTNDMLLQQSSCIYVHTLTQCINTSLWTITLTNVIYSVALAIAIVSVWMRQIMKVMHNAYVCLEFIIEEGQVFLESESFYLYLYAYVYTNTCAVQGIRASAWLV